MMLTFVLLWQVALKSLLRIVSTLLKLCLVRILIHFLQVEIYILLLTGDLAPFLHRKQIIKIDYTLRSLTLILILITCYVYVFADLPLG